MTKYLVIACGVLVLIAGILGWLLLRAHEDLGKANLALKNANAVIAQKEEDARLSAIEVARLQGRVDQLNSTAAPVRERIIHVPTSAVDDPAILAASDGVRALLASPGGPPAGR